MPKTVNVTITLTMSVDVPNSWRDGALTEKIRASVDWSIASKDLRVVIDADSVESDIDVEDEE